MPSQQLSARDLVQVQETWAPPTPQPEVGLSLGLLFLEKGSRKGADSGQPLDCMGPILTSFSQG